MYETISWNTQDNTAKTMSQIDAKESEKSL